MIVTSVVWSAAPALLVDAPDHALEAAGGDPGDRGGDTPPKGRRRPNSRARTGTFPGTFRDARVSPRATRAEGGRFELGTAETASRRRKPRKP